MYISSSRKLLRRRIHPHEISAGCGFGFEVHRALIIGRKGLPSVAPREYHLTSRKPSLHITLLFEWCPSSASIGRDECGKWRLGAIHGHQ